MREMCGLRFTDRKTLRDLLKVLGLNETLDHLSKAKSVHCCEYKIVIS